MHPSYSNVECKSVGSFRSHVNGLFLMLFFLGDSTSHAREQYESMETDEGGHSGPARCKSSYSES